MQEWDGCEYCFEKGRAGFVRLLWEDHAKSVDATFKLVIQTTEDDDELIAELGAL